MSYLTKNVSWNGASSRNLSCSEGSMTNNEHEVKDAGQQTVIFSLLDAHWQTLWGDPDYQLYESLGGSLL